MLGPFLFGGSNFYVNIRTMSRSNRAKLRDQKKRKKIKIATDKADVRYVKMLLTDVKISCASCVWLRNAAAKRLVDDTIVYLLSDTEKYEYPYRFRTCGNKTRFHKKSVEAPLPEERMCGFYEKRERE